MGGFTFRLQKVLDHRSRIEEVKKQAFAESRIKYFNEKQKLDLLHSRLEEFNQQDYNGDSAFSYLVSYNYMMGLEKKIEEQQKVVTVRHDEMEEKKNDFTQSRKDRKVIDKLRENALNRYKTEMDKIEQKQNDEFALYRYVKR